MGKFFFFSLVIPQFGLLSSLRLSSGHSGPVLTLWMQPEPPHPAPTCWWWTRASGLLLCWELWLGTYSVGFFPPGYVALWDSKTPHRPTCERVSCCLETSPRSRFPPQDGSSSLTLLSLFLSFIFCPISFWRERPAFLGAWCPLLAFRSCFVKVIQHSNDLMVNLWGRKWSPHPIPPPSQDHHTQWIDYWLDCSLLFWFPLFSSWSPLSLSSLFSSPCNSVNLSGCPSLWRII